MTKILNALLFPQYSRRNSNSANKTLLEISLKLKILIQLRKLIRKKVIISKTIQILLV